MTQLILDTEEYNVTLPESRKGGYAVDYVPLSVDVEMVTGRLVRELRGHVWEISYQYGYFDDQMKNRVISACEKGRRTAIRCGFLPPDSGGALLYRDFLVTGFTYPKFMWSRFDATDEPIPMWADFTVTLREVRPND